MKFWWRHQTDTKVWILENFEIFGILKIRKNRDLSKGSVINENEISKSKKMKIKRVSNQNGMSLSGHMINLMWQNYHVILKLITIILLSRKWSTNFGTKLRMTTKCIFSLNSGFVTREHGRYVRISRLNAQFPVVGWFLSMCSHNLFVQGDIIAIISLFIKFRSYL